MDFTVSFRDAGDADAVLAVLPAALGARRACPEEDDGLVPLRVAYWAAGWAAFCATRPIWVGSGPSPFFFSRSIIYFIPCLNYSVDLNLLW